MYHEKIYTFEETEQLSNWLLDEFSDYKIFCFSGNLGAGKTTMIASLCKLLGTLDQVSSPTFSIVNQYNTANDPIYHFDLYRLKNLEEAMDMGFVEYIYSGHYCFIEWPEKVTNILPQSLVVHCELSYLSMDKRKLRAWKN